MDVHVAEARPGDAGDLADVLVACVRAGASVGFLAGLEVDEAERWWRSWLADATRVVLVARGADGVIGTVTLLPAGQANGRHRAEVAKLLVAPTARRRGVARTLLAAVERAAAALGRHVLVLDTETGSAGQSLYTSAGWRVVGVIPDYAATVDGALAPTTVMTKRLGR